MDQDRFNDEVVLGHETVRSFMATEGRTRPRGAPELPPETLISVGSKGLARSNELHFEKRQIVTGLESVASIAEIAAHHQLPLRAAVTLVSELVDGGYLEAGDVVDRVGLPLLYQIRDAIAAL